MSNYLEFESGLRFLYQEVLAGFQLYQIDHYPYAIRTDDPTHLITVEVFKVIDPDVEMSIHTLEIGVGYYFDEVKIRGQIVGIYLFEKAGPERLVKGGDWVQFFGS